LPQGFLRKRESSRGSSPIDPPKPPKPPKRRGQGGGKGPTRAEKVIGFIELLTIPSGKGQGEPFRLRPWQKKFIEDIYNPHAGGRRVVRRALLSMGRKNGKTALIAAIALVHLIGPEAVPNGEIYSAANDRDQASIIFKFAAQMVELETELRDEIEIVRSTKTMLSRRTGSVYRAVSAEAGTKHGYQPTVVIYDELAQAKSRDLYDVLDTSFGATVEPLFIIISTQSNDPEHVLSKLIDDGLSKTDPSIVCHLHAADEDCELGDMPQWYKANPALGDFRDYDDFVNAIEKAKRMPAEEPKVRNLLLNQRVSPSATLISRAEWMACKGEVEFEDGEEVYLGLDLSSVLDLTALVMGSVSDPCKIKPFFWKPSEYLIDHSNRDFGSGNQRYVEWRRAGHLRVSPGRSIDAAVVAMAIAELYGTYQVKGLAFDRWRVDDFLRELDRIGMAAYKDTIEPQDPYKLPRGVGLRLVPWGQGYRDMAPAVDALEHAVVERGLVHDGNPVLNWCMANAIATTDPAGNRKLDKEKSIFRIDGAVALAMMMGLRQRDRLTNTVDVDALIGSIMIGICLPLIFLGNALGVS